jgi:membrane protease YdiL (CAAX protease family)
MLVVYMILVWPVLVRRRYRSLERRLRENDPRARIEVYRRMIAHQWAMVLVVAAILALGSIPPDRVGLVKPAGGLFQIEILLIFLAAMGVSGLFFRRRGDRLIQRMLKMAGAILPVTAHERWMFAAISVGAGISEELLFRGFLLYYLDRHIPGLNNWALIPISGIVFGFAHLYQGWRGVLLTGCLGCAFAFFYTFTGSLLAPIVIHAAVDLRLLIIFTPERMRALVAAANAPSVQREGK